MCHQESVSGISYIGFNFVLFVCCHNYIAVCLLYRGDHKSSIYSRCFFFFFGFKRGKSMVKKLVYHHLLFACCVCVCVIEKVHIKGCERVNLSKQHLVRSICLSLPLLSILFVILCVFSLLVLIVLVGNLVVTLLYCLSLSFPLR